VVRLSFSISLLLLVDIGQSMKSHEIPHSISFFSYTINSAMGEHTELLGVTDETRTIIARSPSMLLFAVNQLHTKAPIDKEKCF
jgi:hypothetical protein